MKFICVIGTGRCGSTLVHEVLARHPDAGFISNVDDNFANLDLKGRWNNVLYRRVPVRFTQKGRIRFAPSEAYNLLEKQISPIFPMPMRDLTAADATPWLEKRTREFFTARAEKQRKDVFLHKLTGWPRSGFLQQVFPDAKIVNVIRDGRAVANSWLQMPWWLGYQGPERWQFGPLSEEHDREWRASDRSFAVLAGIAWKILIDAAAEAKAAMPAGQWLDVRYEDLLADPKGITKDVLGWMGLEWNRTFETSFDRYHFSSGRSEAFRKDLGAADLAALDASLADRLHRYGYKV